MAEIKAIKAREVLDSRGNRNNPFKKSIDGKILRTTLTLLSSPRVEVF